MSVSNDYFLLFHGKNLDENNKLEKLQQNDDFLDICALVLCIQRFNYEKFLNLLYFNDLLKDISNNNINNLDDIYNLQYNIINEFKNINKIYQIQRLHSSFDYLKEQNIIRESEHKKLISLFDVDALLQKKMDLDTVISHNIKNKQEFKKEQKKLSNLISKLDLIIKSKDLKNELKNINKYLLNNEFSIGITGIMNSGKSTMINALMGEDILGTSVIPETANLSIIKYGNNDAKIVYWNKQEWSKIENSKDSLDSMKEFVNQTKKEFKDNLGNFIKEKSLEENINIKDIRNYTSATLSNKKCNLIKYVQIEKNLIF